MISGPGFVADGPRSLPIGPGKRIAMAESGVKGRRAEESGPPGRGVPGLFGVPLTPVEAVAPHH